MAMVHCLIRTTAVVHVLVVVDTKKNLVLGGLSDGTFCEILQAMAPTHVETVHRASLFQIESNLDWQLFFVVSRL